MPSKPKSSLPENNPFAMVRNIAASIALAFACSAAALDPPIPSGNKASANPKTETKNHQGDAGRTVDAIPQPSISIAEAPKSSVMQVRSTKEPQQYDWYTTPEWWIVILTGTLSIATIVLAIATIRLYWATKRIADDARIDSDKALNVAEKTSKRQAQETIDALKISRDAANAATAANTLSRENMNAARRAWLSIDDVFLLAPTSVAEDRAMFKISAAVRNLGQTPATSVWVTFHSDIDDGKDSGNYRQAEKRFRASLRDHPVALGVTLFPNDTFVQRDVSAEHLGIASSLRQIDGMKGVFFTIFVGVTYRIVGDDASHITYHPFMSRAPVGSAVDEPVKLERNQFLAGYAD